MWQIERTNGSFLDAGQVAALGALFDGLIPPHQATRLPGASAAGAQDFVSNLLAMSEATYHEIPAWRQLYTQGLAALEEVARTRHGAGLAEIEPGDVVGILKDLEAGALAPFSAQVDQKVLFKTLRRHCIQGCFGDPRWGGNRDGSMWTWLGYPSEVEVS